MSNRAGDLARRERELLDFEARWAVYEGRKEAAIAEHFPFSAQRYYQLLNRLIDKPAALAYDPLTARRLLRRREQRLRRRDRDAVTGRGG